jgi:hypothetical protein
VGNGALALLQSPVAVSGELGSDLLTVNDQGNSLDHAYTISATEVHYLAFPLVLYDTVESLTLHAGAGDNFIQVTPSANTAIDIDGGAPVLPTLPGDTLELDLTGATSPQQTVTSPDSGLVAAWSRGDFNATGTVDGSDFGIWNTNKFLSLGETGRTIDLDSARPPLRTRRFCDFADMGVWERFGIQYFSETVSRIIRIWTAPS